MRSVIVHRPLSGIRCGVGSAEEANLTLSDLCSRRGSALVIAVVVLLALSAIGIFAVSTSTLEMKTSGVDREMKEAFVTGDSGGGMGVHLTRMILHEVPSSVSDLDAPWDNANVVDTALFSGATPELYTDGRNADTPESEPPDIKSQGDSANLRLSAAAQLRVDVDRLKAYQLAGGGTEFGTEYQGIGKGVAGSVGIMFVMDSRGSSFLSSAQAEIETGYLHVVGMPGGMEVTN